MKTWPKVLILAVISVIIATSSCGPAIESAVADTNNKYAVVVGIGDKWASGADNDASLMSRILKQYGFKGKTIELLKNRKATVSAFYSAMLWMAEKEDANSTVVMFFSGHGGRHGFVLWDRPTSYIALNTVFDLFESRKILVMVQGCYSGGLIQRLEIPNSLLLSSSQPDSVSVDGQPYSVWADKFLNYGIAKGYADANGDGVVSMNEAYNYCSMGVMIDNYGKKFIP